MKISPFLLAAGAIAAALYLLKKSGTDQSPAAAEQSPNAIQFPDATQSSMAVTQAPQSAEPVVNMVEETLHRHEGEDNPVIHAFEEAVSHTHEGASPS